jgi:hypothetical protein
MVRPIVAAGIAILFPVLAQGQGHGGMAVVPHVMPVAPRVPAAPSGGVHSAASIRTQLVAGAHPGIKSGKPRSRPRITSGNPGRSGGERRNFDDERALKPGCSSVPGLGFDFPHLAAVCGPDALNAGRHEGLSSFFPIFEGGFAVPGPAAAEESATTDGQSSEDAAEADDPARSRRARVSREEPANIPQADTTPASEPGEYVFVRKDGSVFFAVAYMWEDATLRYVTKEGLKRSATRDSLDLDATQQFNEHLD